MSRKICVITGSRADYGLLRWIIKDIQDNSALELQLIATGMHLDPSFGLTYQEIEADGFYIDKKIETLIGANTPTAVAKSMGLGVIGFADALATLKPDIIVVLGDRFEIFAAVSAALIACIPIAHISGGELSEGAFDDAIRHAITKMSHIHFVGAKEYRNRVIQLGEQPNNVISVGGLGVDNIKRQPLLNRSQLETSLSFNFYKKNLLITFHPTTLDQRTSAEQMRELLLALEQLNDTFLLFTLPNADPGSHDISNLIHTFVSTHPNAKAFPSLGQLRYLSCMQFVDGVIGNSSSGLTEAPSFQIGTINISDRQKGRLKASSVIDCEPHEKSILDALEVLYSTTFQKNLKNVNNPYGNGGASQRIVQHLQTMSLQNLIKKQFHDLPSHDET